MAGPRDSAGYHVSQRKRKLVEQALWVDEDHRRLAQRSGIAASTSLDWQLTFAATAW